MGVMFFIGLLGRGSNPQNPLIMLDLSLLQGCLNLSLSLWICQVFFLPMTTFYISRSCINKGYKNLGLFKLDTSYHYELCFYIKASCFELHFADWRHTSSSG